MSEPFDVIGSVVTSIVVGSVGTSILVVGSVGTSVLIVGSVGTSVLVVASFAASVVATLGLINIVTLSPVTSWAALASNV